MATATTFSSFFPLMLPMASAKTPVRSISMTPGCTLDMDSDTTPAPCLAHKSDVNTTKHLTNLAVLLDCSARRGSPTRRGGCPPTRERPGTPRTR